MNGNKQIVYSFNVSSTSYLTIKGTVHSFIQSYKDNKEQCIECDIEEKWMKVKERENHSSDWIDVDLSELYHCNIIDLNDKGERWEGDSLNSIPFGYGSTYNEENQVIFSGFLYEGKKFFFGVEFFADIDTIEYI